MDLAEHTVSRAVAHLSGPVSAASAPRGALPQVVRPQLATLVKEPPTGDGWLQEIKYDGYRLLARLDRGHVTMLTRNGNDWTDRMPTVVSEVRALPVERALLDGELVILRANGTSDFQALQNALGSGHDTRCVYFVFDILHLDGYQVSALPLVQRKELLRQLLARASGRIRYSEHVTGRASAFFRRACEMGVEGIMCKRADRAYESGRTQSWIKVKCMGRQEFVIGGYSEPQGSRTHLGALLVGTREPGGALRYAGKVGTGFSTASLAELHALLAPLEQARSPFANPPRGAKARGIHWVEPMLVAEIEYAEMTRDGHLRHPSFRGLREDKPAAQVTVERPKPPPQEPAKQAREPANPGRKPARQAPRQAQATQARKPAARARKPAKRAPRRGSRAAGAAKPGPARPADIELPARLPLSNPDKVLYAEQGVRKLDVALYYARVAAWMLPHVVDRPLTLVRCPHGQQGECFFQKHVQDSLPEGIVPVHVKEDDGDAKQYMTITDVTGLISLVQLGVLEIHGWGSRRDRLERPDQIVMDLDPDAAVGWPRVVEGAVRVRDRLAELGLESFVKSTGGKGLHVVVPLQRRTDWDMTKEFCKALAMELARQEPGQYVAVASKAQRTGKIFVDYLRNGRGATAILPYSTRARKGAPVSVPLAWEELVDDVREDHFRVDNVPDRLAALERDPWADFFSVKQWITPAMLRAVTRR